MADAEGSVKDMTLKEGDCEDAGEGEGECDMIPPKRSISGAGEAVECLEELVSSLEEPVSIFKPSRRDPLGVR